MATATKQRASFYARIQDIAGQSDLALVCIRIENQAFTVKELFQNKTLIFPNVQHIFPIDRSNVAVVVPTTLVSSSIDQMLDHFYNQQIVQQTDMVLTFGWAQGQYSSANDLLEAVAQDFLERQLSQGITSTQEPAVLKLSVERVDLQRRYDTLKARLEAHTNILNESYGADEQHIRAEIERLIAVVDHDLGSGFAALRGEITSVSAGSAPLSDETKTTLDWLNREIIVCNAWKRTIGELGLGKVARRETFDVAPWLHEHINLLHRQLALSFSIEFGLPERLLITADVQVLLTACMHMLLAARAAQVQRLDIKAEHILSDGSFSLVFADDGLSPPRSMALVPELALMQKMALPWPYRSLSLVPAMLQQDNISLHCQQHNETVQIVWHVPGTHTDNDRAVTITTFRELQRKVARLEQQIAQLEAIDEANRDTAMTVSGAALDEQVRQILAPYGEKLEQHLQNLIQQAEWLARVAETDNARYTRIRNLALYNGLLACNLSLTLQGTFAPVQRMNINEQVHFVLELLQHKLTHLEITLDLAPDVPDIAIASVEIKQVFMNLFKNAAEATGKGGTLHITTTHWQGSVLIRIRDTGTGIPTHVSEKIFDLHFSTKGKGTNSGIGLHAVQSIVQRAGGQVAVASATLNDKDKLVSWQKGFNRLEHFDWSAPGTIFQIGFPADGES
jgi:signal transduction histidine kinase